MVRPIAILSGRGLSILVQSTFLTDHAVFLLGPGNSSPQSANLIAVMPWINVPRVLRSIAPDKILGGCTSFLHVYAITRHCRLKQFSTRNFLFFCYRDRQSLLANTDTILDSARTFRSCNSCFMITTFFTTKFEYRDSSLVIVSPALSVIFLGAIARPLMTYKISVPQNGYHKRS